jgi:chemotaxis protein MotB
MSSKDEPRVRIIVKKSHGGGHHGGAWKVAYADFVTTMMALFIVLWIISQSEAVKVSIATYFKDPGAFKEGRAPLTTPGGSGLLPGGRPDPEILQQQSQAAVHEEQVLQETATRIRELAGEGGPFAHLKDQIEIKVAPDGLRIELMERDGVPFFQVGSATLMSPLKPLLESVEPILRDLPNSITVEGHTDGRQYTERKNYSNWELSTDRAHAARRVMEEHGLQGGHIDRVSGHADKMLRVSDDPMHASNRRITLLVRRQEKPVAEKAAAKGSGPAPGGAPVAAPGGGTPGPVAAVRAGHH